TENQPPPPLRPPVLPSLSPPVSQSSGSTVQLIADHEVVNLPSASALSLIRRESAGRQAATKTLAALADPVFDTDDPRLATARKKPPAHALVANAPSPPSTPTS